LRVLSWFHGAGGPPGGGGPLTDDDEPLPLPPLTDALELDAETALALGAGAATVCVAELPAARVLCRVAIAGFALGGGGVDEPVEVCDVVVVAAGAFNGSSLGLAVVVSVVMATSITACLRGSIAAAWVTLGWRWTCRVEWPLVTA
jgi:hypothetical protein